MQSIEMQNKIKRFEFELKPKQEGYSKFMENLNKAFRNAYVADPKYQLDTSLSKAESAYYSLVFHRKEFDE